MIACPSQLVTDVEVLLRTAEAALAVESRQQFYLWTRLHLHRFVPHELMLCRLGGQADADAQVHAFNSVALPEGLLRQLSAPRSAFWRGLHAGWQKDQHRATWRSLREEGEPELQLDVPGPCSELEALLHEGLTSVWVHGVNASHGIQPEALFVFIGRGQSLPAMACHALAFWQPYLHFAAVRALGSDAAAARPRNAAVGGGVPSALLSDREVEVLAAVRQAHRNAEIADQLGISPLTVKNHLRKIMKKLGARNRTEAVAEAISLQLIS